MVIGRRSAVEARVVCAWALRMMGTREMAVAGDGESGARANTVDVNGRLGNGQTTSRKLDS
jgi:hypothetical protein